MPVPAPDAVSSASPGADPQADRLEKLEAEIKSLKGKGLAIAVISALLGSGGATAIATTYLSGRTLAVQERVAALQEKQANSEIAQKALQNQQIVLQNRQIEADTKLKQQTIASDKVKADQESFEKRLKAYTTTVDTLRADTKSALKAGDIQKAAALEVERSREIQTFRAFLDLQKRYVEENPNVPGWYRLGIAQARQECSRIDQQR
jgi:hypothetical protein